MVWVKDASRSVPTAAALLERRAARPLLADVKADYDSIRPGTPPSTTGRCSTLEEARRANRTPIDWAGYQPPVAARPGRHVLDDYDLAELRDYIDWQPFFNAWEMKGKFPDILNNPRPRARPRASSTTTRRRCSTG